MAMKVLDGKRRARKARRFALLSTSPKKHESTSQSISVFIIETTPLACQLLSGELQRLRNHFELVAATNTPHNAFKQIAQSKPDVAVISSELQGDTEAGFKIVRELHAGRASTIPVMLLGSSEEDLVVKAFSAGAKGVLSRSESVDTMCKCIESVAAGQIWANSIQLHWLVHALAENGPVRLISAKGSPLLTERAQQIVQMASSGMLNREIAKELGLSTHTVKNHLFRIYEKLGISTRVELLLYAMGNRDNSNHPVKVLPAA